MNPAPPQVEVGAVVPPLVRTIDLPSMVAYAGATWDWHRLHYDTAYLAQRKLPAPVVDGQVFGALLAETLQDWLGPYAWVSELSFRFRSLVFAGETVRCEGTVTDVDDTGLACALRVVVLPVPTGDAEVVKVAAEPCAARVRWRR